MAKLKKEKQDKPKFDTAVKLEIDNLKTALMESKGVQWQQEKSKLLEEIEMSKLTSTSWLLWRDRGALWESS